ncbi:MAG: hypothetical protein WC933_02825 [Candidatus Paceibacterota bacterium]|jgi:flagellar biosynthesis protein FliP
MIDIGFLLSGSVVAVLLVQVLKDLFGIVSKRWGALLAQFTLLVISFGIAGVGVLFQKLPPEIIESTFAVFASAMVVYETIWKAIWKDAIKGV